MADDFELRAYCYIDRMQPQYASFVGTVTQGDLPIEGMAAHGATADLRRARYGG